MASLNTLSKKHTQFSVIEVKSGNLLTFPCIPKNKIQPSNNNKLLRKAYPSISKDDRRKPLRSVISDPNLLKQKEFAKLVTQWKEETAGNSSISKKLLNLAYLRVIAMGEIAVPLILKELKRSPDHWFIALKAITSADPVSNGASFEQAVDSWLKWGQNQGLID